MTAGLGAAAVLPFLARFTESWPLSILVVGYLAFLSHYIKRRRTLDPTAKWHQRLVRPILVSLGGEVMVFILPLLPDLSRRHPGLAVLLAAETIFLVFYIGVVNRRKKEGSAPYRKLDLALFCALLIALLVSVRWGSLRREQLQRANRQILEISNIGVNLKNDITTFLKARRSLPPEVNDSSYSYDRILVNMYLVERTGVIEMMMHGEPTTPAAGASPVKVSFLSDVSLAKPERFIAFQQLRSPDEPLNESRMQRPLGDGVPFFAAGIRALTFQFRGSQSPFWSRRVMCWPGSMPRDSDFFMVFLEQFLHIEANRIRLNFYADRPVDVALSSVPVDIQDPKQLVLTTIPAMSSRPSPARWQELRWTRGRPLGTTKSWEAPVLDPKVLVAVFSPAPAPPAGVE